MRTISVTVGSVAFDFLKEKATKDKVSVEEIVKRLIGKMMCEDMGEDSQAQSREDRDDRDRSAETQGGA